MVEFCLEFQSHSSILLFKGLHGLVNKRLKQKLNNTYIGVGGR